MQIYASLLSVIIGMVMVAAGAGLMTTHAPTVLGLAGFDTEQMGMVVTAYAVGMFASCFTGGWLIRRVGHIRAFATYAALVIMAMMSLSQVAMLEAWMLMRCITGFSSNSMFMVAQSWLNEAAPSHMRGRIMSFFYVSFTLGYGIGAFLLTQIEVDGMLPYLVAAGCYCLAIIPVSTTLLPSPELPERFAIDLLGWLRRCPVGIIGAFASGALAMTLQGVGAIYGGLIGLAPASIALLMASTQVGNLLFQWPLGVISDRVDRRSVIFVAALACGSVCLALAFWPSAWLPILIVSFAVFAGCGESIYALSTAHANDRAEPGDHLSLASTLLVAWATGATLGPMVATAAMSQGGAVGLPIYFAVVALSFAVYTLWRRVTVQSAEQQPHEDYVPIPQSAMLADEATLYADDDSVVWEEPAAGKTAREGTPAG